MPDTLQTGSAISLPGQEGPGVVDGRGNARHTNLPALKDVRRDLRNHATLAERALWQTLKGSQLEGQKFRRQHSIGRYIVDFYCPDERLAIELDGSVHDDPLRRRYDAKRQSELEALGVRVLRFENHEVLQTPDVVAAAIAAHFSIDVPGSA